MRDAFIARLTELAEADPRIVLIIGDLGFGVFDRYRKDLPAQFINAGVCEQQMTMLATGMAMVGWTAFTYSIGNFPTLRPLEMIRNDAAYHEANVKVVCIGGGFSYGALGPSHHATEDIAIMRALPNVKVVVPSGRWEAAEATTAVTNEPGTIYLRLDKSHGVDSPADGEVFELGKARELLTGADVTIITAGGILGEVLAAADRLAASGVRARVVSMHTVKPLDDACVLKAAQETGGIVTVEEHTLFGGLGSAVGECLMDAGVAPKRFLRIGVTAGFSSVVGSQEYLRATYGLDSEAIAGKVLRLLNGPPAS